MPDRKFLTEYPLYRPFAFDGPRTLNEWPKVSINMHCSVCRSAQTFNMSNQYYNEYMAVYGYGNYPAENTTVLLRYRCNHCTDFERVFVLRIGEDRTSIVKIGQHPAWDIHGNSDVEKLLGAHASHYKRGLICESQGYGIGAFAYYRRIVEEIIDSLLEQVGGLLSGEEKIKYAEALAKTKTTRITSEKIELVKDLLPAILRPDNMNPLSTLHEVLSEGLHADADERCLELASAIRQVLTFLTAQIATTTAAGKGFSESMRGLLEAKTAKTAGKKRG
jgi:hypothetical protein